MSLFVLAVGLVGCRYLRLLSDLLVGAGVSAVGTTLLQSPGWNEGKARNATLGKHGQERIELRRSGTFSASICRGVVPPLQGSFSDGASMLLYWTVSNCYCEHAYLLSFDKIGVL